MVTLREFLKMIDREHYRIYQPNRDCLIFESYFTVHSPYKFNKSLDLQQDYWDNNKYNNKVREEAWKNPAYDKETARFLDKFGDYEVFSVEIGSFAPCNLSTNKNGTLKIDYVKDKSQPNRECLNCFDVFIIPYSANHERGCKECFHRLFKETKTKHKHIPDEKDVECKKCPHYIDKQK